MDSDILLTIIIPARSEEANIVQTLQTLQSHVKTPHRIIIVNDKVMRSDKTAEAVKVFSLKNKNISVLINNRIGHTAPGFGLALITGIKKAATPFIVIVMADLSDDPTTIDRMYKRACEGADVVCGSRYINGGTKNGGPILQGFFSRLANWSLHTVARMPTTDATNAFKLYRRELIEKLPVDPSGGVECSLAILLHAYWAHAKIIDIPTHWCGRTAGISTFHLFERMPRYARLWWLAMKRRFF